MPKAKASEPKTTLPEGTEKMDSLEGAIPEFKVKKAVSLPTLKWGPGETLFIAFESPIEIKKTVDPKTEEEKDIEVAKVKNLRNDSQYNLVCGVVLKKEMDIGYTSDSYVGKTFKITKHKVPNKRYHTFEIYEIEV